MKLTKLDTARCEALKLIHGAQRLMLDALPAASGGTSYSALPERDRQMVDCLAMAQSLAEPVKQVSTGALYGSGITFTSGVKTPSDATMRKARNQNLRIAKAVDRMSKKGFRCPRG